MEKQFTANEVRRLSNRIPRSNDEIADAQEALRAFADMLEAREKAVPVAECGHSSTVEHRASNANVTGSSPAARSNSDAERLAEALRQIAVTTKGYPNASREGEIAIKALAAHSAQAQPPAASVPEALRLLQSVLCDTDGNCCIRGTYEDRRTVDKALAMLAAQEKPNG